MPRLRTLKPEFFTHELLCELGPLHRLLYEGLWVYADREGRLEDRPRYLKTVILPYDECDIDSMLSDLEARGFVRRYEADGKRCIHIPAFLRHQNPHPKEKPSVLPVPPIGSSTLAPRLPTPVQGVAITHAAEMPVQAAERVSTSREKISTSRAVLSIGLGSCLGEKRVRAEPAPPPPEERLREVWNQNRPPELPEWKHTGSSRKHLSVKALKRRPIEGEEGWLAVMLKLAASGFCRGLGGGWKADPDWWLRPEGRKPEPAQKLLEGAYDDSLISVRPPSRADPNQGIVRQEQLDTGAKCSVCGEPATTHELDEPLCHDCSVRRNAQFCVGKHRPLTGFSWEETVALSEGRDPFKGTWRDVGVAT